MSGQKSMPYCNAVKSAKYDDSRLLVSLSAMAPMSNGEKASPERSLSIIQHEQEKKNVPNTWPANICTALAVERIDGLHTSIVIFTINAQLTQPPIMPEVNFRKV